MNEIITFAGGYDIQPGIEVFLKSSRDKGSRVVIDLECKESLRQRFEQEPSLTVIDARILATKYNVALGLSPYTLKVIFFYLYCKHYSKAEKVYLCDLTDVYFQKDPFLMSLEDKAYVTSENCLIRDCKTNAAWINHCYNADIYNILKDKEILNGGSILGEREKAVELLGEMCADMTQIIARVGNYPNIDQASMNKVVYFDQHRYGILNKKEVVNMAHSPEDTDFHNTHIIHQYDVNKPLMNQLYNTYK